MNKKTIATAAVTASAATLLAGCANSTSATNAPKTVTINYSAAASLQPALTSIYKTYHEAHPNITIDFDFAGSGAIRQKVLAGAPIDGVFLASTSDMEKLGDKVTAESSALGNELVAVVPATSTASGSISELVQKAKKIAIGEPATVPAGMYASQTLTKLDLTKTAQSKLVEGSDVTQVLSYVAAGNADLGFIYKTDAATNKNVKIVATVPASDHAAIIYPLATIKGTNKAETDATEAFNSYLKSDAAKKVFEAYKFTIQP